MCRGFRSYTPPYSSSANKPGAWVRCAAASKAYAREIGWFEKVVETAKIENLRWHDLRHTLASRLVMAGVSHRAVQTILGHKRIETTLWYSHLAKAHLREAVERNG
jgi:site-specific recombinase XerD